MSFALAATTVLFSLADPQGDALGDGAYRLPTQVQSAATNLDLRSFTAFDNNGKLGLRLALAGISNVAGAPNGFDTSLVEVFLGNQRGGIETLGSSGLRTPPAKGWQYHLSASGWFAHLECPGLHCDTTTSAHVEGASVVLETNLPAKAYVYWAFVGLYDPLTPDGLAQAQATPDAGRLFSSLPDAPAALDVLASNSQLPIWNTREVAPVGEIALQTNPLLWLGLAGSCVFLGGSLWGLLRRR